MGVNRAERPALLTRLTVLLSVLAILGGALLAMSQPFVADRAWSWGLLASLALLAELWPVSIFRRGLRITFTMPYLVGVAAVAGPFDAMLVDIAVSLLAAISIRVVGKTSVSIHWVVINVAVAALGSVAGGFGWIFAKGLAGEVGVIGMVAPVLGFVVAYSVVNFVAVSMLDRTINGAESRENVLKSLKPGFQAVGLYFLVAILVALLVKLGYPAFAALTIVPIATLRYALQARAKLYDHYYDTVSTLALMLQRVHPYTLGHLRRVSSIAEEVALELGLSSNRARLVREAAVLHDIGKIAVDEAILDKPGRLTEEEFDHIKRHAAYGALILSPVENFQPMVKWIRHHHERPDGTGYPDQLTDLEIPIESKIIAVVDAYDAMTGSEGEEKRSYREPMTSAEAILELERCSGSQFDPRVVSTFKSVIMGGAA